MTPQRLLVQTSVQAKPGHVSPLQLTNISVPQQVRLPHLALALTVSPGCRTNLLKPAGTYLTSTQDTGPIQGLPSHTPAVPSG